MSELLVLFPTDAEAAAVFPNDGGDPTAEEVADASVRPTVALCGFGVVGAAATTARLVERSRPARVLLLGLGGSFDLGRAGLRTLVTATAISGYGIGMGEREGFRSAGALGFEELPGAPDERLDAVPVSAPDLVTGEIVSPAAGSTNPRMAERHRAGAAGVLIEDLESWGVALACRAAGVELSVVRAVCNEVGESDRSRWDIGGALAVLRRRAPEILSAIAAD